MASLARYTESMAATGDGTARQFVGDWWLKVGGSWTGTWVLAASFDGGSNYDTIYTDTAVSATGNHRIYNPHPNVLWRLSFTRSGGTLTATLLGVVQ